VFTYWEKNENQRYLSGHLLFPFKTCVILFKSKALIFVCMSGTCWPPLQKGCIRDFLCRYSKLPPQNIVYMYLLIICMCFADGGTILATYKILLPHIHQLVKDKVKVLGIWFGKDHINTNWLQIQNKVKIQFEKWKDRRLSLRHKVLIINTYILSSRS
jgi:hypothetical protein